jgi:hypothetical protein
VASDAARSVFPVGRSAKTLRVADDLTFVAGDVSIPEADMLVFLRRCWQRQRAGKPPFSRNFWTRSRSMDRGQYESVMLILESAGLCIGRKHGYSGKMLAPPLTSINDLRHKLT